ncbi:hypothetical protein [Vibrio parahaemolyticus]|uniref:hypothetical protein n=1 Tax=Vibrio parahaemolyticus TaxID=670 RepID=UPI00214C7B22|nr:hypothetical protein [Vibrio parahaemolyticus]
MLGIETSSHLEKSLCAYLLQKKPSLAAAIFKGLGGNPDTEKKRRLLPHGQDVVTWCLGHLLALCDPEDYNIET